MNPTNTLPQHDIPTQHGRNFSVAQTGAAHTLERFAFHHPGLPRPAKGKLFLKDLLHLTGIEVSLNKLPAGHGMPFSHSHRLNEELYLFMGGYGEFQVDGEVLSIEPGTVIRVSPEGRRAWRNHSTEDLYFICIQARVGSMPDVTIADGVPVAKPLTWPD